MAGDADPYAEIGDRVCFLARRQNLALPSASNNIRWKAEDWRPGCTFNMGLIEGISICVLYCTDLVSTNVFLSALIQLLKNPSGGIKSAPLEHSVPLFEGAISSVKDSEDPWPFHSLGSFSGILKVVQDLGTNHRVSQKASQPGLEVQSPDIPGLLSSQVAC
jgi:hypothetical protein